MGSTSHALISGEAKAEEITLATCKPSNSHAGFLVNLRKNLKSNV